MQLLPDRGTFGRGGFHLRNSIRPGPGAVKTILQEMQKWNDITTKYPVTMIYWTQKRASYAELLVHSFSNS